MVIQMMATEAFQKHDDVSHDESDLIGARLKLIIQHHHYGRSHNILAHNNTRPKEDQ